jgi:hypothetical protein
VLLGKVDEDEDEEDEEPGLLYNGVAMLSQCCYYGVRMVLQWCYNRVLQCGGEGGGR